MLETTKPMNRIAAITMKTYTENSRQNQDANNAFESGKRHQDCVMAGYELNCVLSAFAAAAAGGGCAVVGVVLASHINM